MAKSGYVPNAGDVVWFSLQAGHEQAGHRQAVVLTQAGYNRASGMMICMPMTTQIMGSVLGADCQRQAQHGAGRSS